MLEGGIHQSLLLKLWHSDYTLEKSFKRARAKMTLEPGGYSTHVADPGSSLQ